MALALSSPSLKRRAGIATVLGLLAIAAWLASVARMDGFQMNGGRFSVGSFGFFVLLWVLMMSAMMFPSVWPAVAVYGLIARRRSGTGASEVGRLATFVVGYVGSWTAFGLAAFGVLAAARGAGLDALSNVEIARYVVAPVAFVAAAYQLVPFKQACLSHCRGPFAFFLEQWRDGVRGAIVMGARHGGYCVGCCWMLMLVLLAIGVMSISWMAIVSCAIAVEKLAPPRAARFASGAVTAALATIALAALVKPSWFPGMGGMSEHSRMGVATH